jgi:hypothetical protein
LRHTQREARGLESPTGPRLGVDARDSSEAHAQALCRVIEQVLELVTREHRVERARAEQPLQVRRLRVGGRSPGAAECGLQAVSIRTLGDLEKSIRPALPDAEIHVGVARAEVRAPVRIAERKTRLPELCKQLLRPFVARCRIGPGTAQLG